MGANKIIYGGKTLIDLTSDTVEEDKLLKGYTAHNAAGDPIVGTYSEPVFDDLISENLLFGTRENNSSTLSYYRTSNNDVQFFDEDGYGVIKSNGIGVSYMGFFYLTGITATIKPDGSVVTDLKPGDYTFSCDWKTNINYWPGIQCRLFKKSGNSYVNADKFFQLSTVSAPTLLTNEEWGHIKPILRIPETITWNSSTSVINSGDCIVCFGFVPSATLATGKYFQIKKPKLEIGVFENPIWTPAYKDFKDAGSNYSDNLLRGTNSVTTLTSTGTWTNGTWRSASSGVGTRSSITITDCPNPSITKGWRIEKKENTAAGVDICQDNIPLVNGQMYTVSCYARLISGEPTLRFQCGDGGTNNKISLISIKNKEWTRYSFAFKYDTSSNVNAYFGLSSTIGVVDICGMKLEVGDIEADRTVWTPSYQDFVSENKKNQFDDNIVFNNTNNGVLLKDKTGYNYPGSYDNGTNLWIGAKASQSTHHTGKTHISSGYDSDTKQGNETIYVAVPNSTNDNADSYPVIHSKNMESYLNRFGLARRCMVGHTNIVSSTTKQWFKVASTTINTRWEDTIITFKVMDTMPVLSANHAITGILTAQIRVDDPPLYQRGYLRWDYVSEDVDLSNFVLLHKNVDNARCDIELWVKIPYNYVGFAFEVLSESSRNAFKTAWNLYTRYADGGDASELPSGYTQIPSTVMPLKNVSNSGGGSYSPIDEFLSDPYETIVDSSTGSITQIFKEGTVVTSFSYGDDKDVITSNITMNSGSYNYVRTTTITHSSTGDHITTTLVQKTK